MELKFGNEASILPTKIWLETRIRRKSQELQEFARRNGITSELLQVIHALKPRLDLTKFGGPEPDLSKPERKQLNQQGQNRWGTT